MQDLNDLYLFAKVVEHGGFAMAARAIGVQKSKLSRRIAVLEDRLGVRLLQRSSRRFSVTDVGQEFYQHCLAMIVEADAAQSIVEHVRAAPQGSIRVACPPGLLAYRIGEVVSHFLKEHPKVEVQLKAFNRRVDIIGEGFDIVICTGADNNARHATLVTRKIGEISYCLVASPDLLGHHQKLDSPADLAVLPTIDFGLVRDDEALTSHRWTLKHAEGPQAVIPHRPRLVSDDEATLRFAALAGVGAALLPSMLVKDDIAAGNLVELLPGWRSSNTPVQAVFPSRRGLLPSLRVFLDFVADECSPFRRGTRLDTVGSERA
ncbi:MAG: LysR family transcriptional regulator [Xanthobacteraceae bacterium]|nr:LysR family transcriptional regulator [Xanthobacteraceae bacterium]